MATWEPCSVRVDCPFCGEGKRTETHWHRIADFIACICLKERSDRYERACEESHKVGLCSFIQFYRAVKNPDLKTDVNIWNSHQAVARHALSLHAKRLIILEDDFQFRRTTLPLTQIEQDVSNLDAYYPSWDIYYLGHFPLLSIPAFPPIRRVWSQCAHALVMNDCMIQRLSSLAPKYIQTFSSVFGNGIDCYFMLQSKTFAPDKILCVQHESPNDHRKASWIDYAITHGWCYDFANSLSRFIPFLFVLVVFLLLNKKHNKESRNTRKQQQICPSPR